MLNPKLQCPICNQEFPAYDQRGFRNAGFTSHHNRCLERHEQQQNVAHQRDKQSCRAVRFAMAIKRRLLPAQPISPAPTNTAIERKQGIHTAYHPIPSNIDLCFLHQLAQAIVLRWFYPSQGLGQGLHHPYHLSHHQPTTVMRIALDEPPSPLRSYLLKHFHNPYNITERLDKGTLGIIGKQGRTTEDRQTHSPWICHDL
ncbi:hypothetical protein [Absidia glauca]|uniref:Uncharacterized protein n=1 Tax=Absidia glauca TaxID=4829 RepID=A0A163ITS9_ABSGL|nr:hypothetical protein [Absidia glauca]